MPGFGPGSFRTGFPDLATMDHLQEQEMELEALRAILMDDFEELEHNDEPTTGLSTQDKCYRIALSLEDDATAQREKKDTVRLALYFSHTLLYPEDPPLLSVRSVQGVSQRDVERIRAKLEEMALENLGMSMMFTLASAAREWLSDMCVQQQRSVAHNAADDGDEEEDAEDVEEIAEALGRLSSAEVSGGQLRHRTTPSTSSGRGGCARAESSTTAHPEASEFKALPAHADASEFKTLAGRSMAVVDIKKSKFVTIAAPVDSEAAAHAFLNEVSDMSATHNCWAFKIGGAYRCNDDGEPSGTAGRPILTAIETSGLDRVCVCVTRYFGGIKLGRGGLIRAYGGCASSCLENAATRVVKLKKTVDFHMDYSRLSAVYSLVHRFGTDAEVLSVDFEDGGGDELSQSSQLAGMAVVLLSVSADRVERLMQELQEKVEVEGVRWLGAQYETFC